MINNKIIFTVMILVLVAVIGCGCVFAATQSSRATESATNPATAATASAASIAADGTDGAGRWCMLQSTTSKAVSFDADAPLQLSFSELEIPLYRYASMLHRIPNGSEKELTWTSSDESIATVDAHGIIDSQKEGTATIICSDGVNTVSCKVIVTPHFNLEYKLHLDYKELNLQPGDEGEVQYTSTSTNAVCIFSNHPEIVAVENGCYKAIAPGTAVITCTDGIWNSQCFVTVTESDAPV